MSGQLPMGHSAADGQRQGDWERDGSGRWPLRISWGGVPGPSLARLAATQAGMRRAVGAGSFLLPWLSVRIRGLIAFGQSHAGHKIYLNIFDLGQRMSRVPG